MDIEKMIDSYKNWFGKNITVHKVGDYCEITVPFLDSFFDFIQIYVKQTDENNLILTDDGHAVGNLKACGIQLQEGFLESVLPRYELSLNGEEITVVASIEDFPQKMHMMIQGMLLIDAYFCVFLQK